MYYYKGDNMKAVVKTEVGFDNMVYKEVEEPKAERDLVKIKIAYSGMICPLSSRQVKYLKISTDYTYILIEM